MSDPTDKFDLLRREAEELMRREQDGSASAAVDLLELIHELRIHQTELQLQNEELKRADLELTTLNQEFSDLYEYAPCGYITLNARGVISRINLQAVQLLGEVKSSLASTGFSQYIAPEWRNQFLMARYEAGRTGRRQSLELKLQRDIGSCPWVRMEIDTDREKDGRVIEWRLILLDISRQKKAEAAMAAIEETFHMLSDMSSESIVLHDNGRIVFANNQFYQMCGYRPGELQEVDLVEKAGLRNPFRRRAILETAEVVYAT